jgi:hypothetical protein
VGAQFNVNADAVALSAAATKSLWLLNPVTNKFLIKEIGVSFDQAAAEVAVKVQLCRVVTIGSAAGSAFTPSPYDPGTQAATTTALTNLTTEPTTYLPFKGWYIQPAGGLFVVQFPLGIEPPGLAAGARWGLRAITPTGVTSNCCAYVDFEE